MEVALLWLERLLTLLPSIERLWRAAESRDPQAELEAQLALTRAVKDQQAREEIAREAPL